MTVKDGSSRSQAEVHQDEQEAVTMADMRLVHDLLNWELLEKLINLGMPLSKEGFFQFEELSRIPISEQIENDLKLANLVDIPQSYFYEKYNLPQPKEGEAVAGREAHTPKPTAQNSEEDEDETDRALRELHEEYLAHSAQEAPFETRDLDQSDLDSILQTLLDFAQNYSGGDILQSPQFATLVQQQGDILAEAVLTGYGPIHHAVDQAAADHLRQNVYVFSGFKTYEMLRKATDLLQDAQGNPRPFSEVLRDVQKLHKTYVKNYLKAEYQHAIASSQMASKWQDFERRKDSIDIRYDAVNDGRTRASHRALHGIVRPVDDPFWNTYYPTNGWGCRCTAHAVPKGTQGSKVKIDDLPAPDKPMFKYNVGKTGSVFPSKHPYYEAHKKRKSAIGGKVDEQGAKKAWWNRKKKPKKTAKPTPKPTEKGTPLARLKNILAAKDDPQRAFLEEGIKQAQQVMDFSKLPPVLIRSTSTELDDNTAGKFIPSRNLMLLNVNVAPQNFLTLFHELGHYWDFHQTEEKGYGVVKLPKYNAFLEAAYNSQSYLNIEGLLKHRKRLTTEQIKLLLYLKEDEEVFARAFSQFLAQKTNNQNALLSVKEKRDTHWIENDFAAISKALNKLLQ